MKQIRLRGTWSSFYRDTDGTDNGVEVREVPVVTLDQLCRDRKIAGPYVVKVDVQAAELEVLAGTRAVLPETEVVILEVLLIEMYAPHLSVHLECGS